MGRRLILCIDGTDNSPTALHRSSTGEPEAVRTNVSRFFRTLVKNGHSQLAYYQPGVGTIDPERSNSHWARLRNSVGRKYDGMIGWMFNTHTSAAYRYLMDQYQDGDDVFLLGFSRGAFICRVLAGMLHKVGLLHGGQEEMLSFAWQVYTPRDNFEAAGRFKKFYARPVKIRFLGLWDTVNSVGNPFHLSVFPSTLNNHSVEVVRHAMAIDERRVMFLQNMWTDSPTDKQDVLQVWFPGVHADIGGGYTGDSSPGLAGIPLAWMIREARAAGVEFDTEQEQRLVWPRQLAPPPELTVEAVTEQYANADQHDEIKAHLHWRIVEQLPLPRSRRLDEHRWKREFSRHRSAPRSLKTNEGTVHTVRVHHSADIRREKRPEYNPPNLLPAEEIERVW
jgi:uncharacterized protein (DUF2235 family)